MAAASTITRSVWGDIREGFGAHRLWRFMAKRELARQHARTLLGTGWISANVLVHVLLLGAIYSLIFEDGKAYFAYWALSYSIWKAFGQMLGSSVGLWTSSEKYVKHLPAPTSLFIVKGVYKMWIVFALSLPVGIVCAVFAGVRPSPTWALSILGIVLFFANLFWFTTIASLLALRFRDVRKALPQVTFIIYLSTPIMWQRERLGDHAWIADINPVYHLISVVREPLLGAVPSVLTWSAVIAMALVGNAAAVWAIAMTRRRIPLWL